MTEEMEMKFYYFDEDWEEDTQPPARLEKIIAPFAFVAGIILFLFILVPTVLLHNIYCKLTGREPVIKK